MYVHCMIRTVTIQAVKRSERLIVSALSALSNFLEAVGPEANSALCAVPSDHDDAGAAGADEDGQSRSVSLESRRCTFASGLVRSPGVRHDASIPVSGGGQQAEKSHGLSIPGSLQVRVWKGS